MKIPLRLNNRSRVKGDFYARICERLRGKFPGSTRFIITGRNKEILEYKVMPLIKEFLSVR